MRPWPPLIITALAIACPRPGGAQTRSTSAGVQEFALDAGHTIIEFSVGFAVTHVKGRFTQSRGTILYDAAHPESSSVTLIIDAKSIDTGWPHRDEHLRTDDFFDVEKFPAITFQSDRVTRRGAEWVASGPFTMHGITKRMSIPFHLLQQPSRGAGSNMLTLNAAGALRIARKDFGILGGSTHNSWFNALRNATVADTVDVSLEIAGWVDDPAVERPAEITALLDRIKSAGAAAQVDRLRQVKATKTAQEFDQYFHGGDVVVRALIADNRAPEAVALSRGLAELFPQRADAQLVYGLALSASGDTKAAAVAYAKALTIDPNDTRAIEWKRRLNN